MSGTTFTWTGAATTDWNTASNWQIGSVVATVPPNSPTAVVIATTGDPIISGGSTDTVASLNIGGTAHVIVGGGVSVGGGGGGTLTSIGTITVTSTNSGGGLVPGPNSVVTAPALVMGPGAIVGGGGRLDIASITNAGIIQADGADFALGPLVVTGGTITGSGSIEIDGPSTLQLGSGTAQNILIANTSPQVSTVILENPTTFTGTVDLYNPNTYVNFVFPSGTARGLAINATGQTLTDVENGVTHDIPISVNTADFVQLTGGAGNDTIFGSGNSTIAGSGGTNTLVANATGGSTDVISSGASDLVVAAAGNTTVSSTGNNTGIFASGTGTLTATLTGSGDTVAAGSAASASITATGGGALVFAGTGALSFVGGTGTTTILGSSGGVVNYAGSSAGALLLAGTGNETLNASGSSTSNFFSGSSDGSGAELMVGGLGGDTMSAGAGAVTMTGGGSPDAFVFFNASTAGQHDFVTDLTGEDSVYLLGYDPSQSASTLVNAATVGASGVTLTLSDSTQITFTDLTSAAQLNGKIFYG